MGKRELRYRCISVAWRVVTKLGGIPATPAGFKETQLQGCRETMQRRSSREDQVVSVFIWIVPGNDESGEPLSVDPADVFVAIRWDGKRGPRRPHVHRGEIPCLTFR